MENTIENKERFFALYWGQRNIWHVSNKDWNPKINGFILDNINSKLHLQLKPPQSISDEDAIECYDIFISCVEVKKIKIKWIKEHLDVVIKETDISDYLRSKGYALPFMGVDVETLVSWGWVKLKTD